MIADFFASTAGLITAVVLTVVGGGLLCMAIGARRTERN
jgi:hypothetical protein